MINVTRLKIILALAIVLVVTVITGCRGTTTEEPTTFQPTQTAASPIVETTHLPEDDQAQPSESEQPKSRPSPTPDEPVGENQSHQDDLVAKLSGLTIDEFFESSWRALMLRDPEWVLSEGLADGYGLEGVTLTNISDEYIRETQEIYKTVLDRLHTYNRDELTDEQQISFDVYAWYLDDQVRGAEFLYYDYPVTFFPVTSVHEGVMYFFTDLHPVTSKQDAEDYVTRLGQVDTKFAQLIEGLKLREAEGVVPPKFAIQWAMYGINNLANTNPISTPYYQAFRDQVLELEDLTNEEKGDLLAAAEASVEDSVLPAYRELAQYLEHQESIAPDAIGVGQFERGDSYYEYILRHFNTTDLTADEIHDLGLRELDRIQSEMRLIFDQLGYPQDESLSQLYDRVALDGGSVSSQNVIDTYESIIDEAEKDLDGAFGLRPQAELIVITSPIKGMYVHPSLDGSRPGAFHAGPGNITEEYYAMPTLAYHEGVPGHHYQISLAQEADLPTFRNMMSFSGYAEGWALYAEQLASELGWYEDDPYGDLGRLQGEAFRAARLVVDTGIHARGWTFEESEQFLSENTGFESGDSLEPSGQIARYIVWPGQSTAYKIGMIKILELRQRAMDQLGDQFDLKEFHNVVLSRGSMPLEVLERVVDLYIESARQQ